MCMHTFKQASKSGSLDLSFLLFSLLHILTYSYLQIYNTFSISQFLRDFFLIHFFQSFLPFTSFFLLFLSLYPPFPFFLFSNPFSFLFSFTFFFPFFSFFSSFCYFSSFFTFLFFTSSLNVRSLFYNCQIYFLSFTDNKHCLQSFFLFLISYSTSLWDILAAFFFLSLYLSFLS